MTIQTDPLESLISSDSKSLDRQKLAELLQPFVIIDKETKGFSFLPAFEEISSNTQKIEIVLAASKACSLLFNEMPDGLTPGEMIDLGIMPEGSIKSSVKRLSDTHKIKKDKESRYSLPAYRVADVIKQFSR